MDRADAIKLLVAEGAAWAITPAALDGVIAALTAGARLPTRQPQRSPGGGVAIIPVIGVLLRRPGVLHALLGLGDAGTYVGIQRRLGEAVRDPAVERIALLVDSPGGLASGCQECAEAIAAAAKVKPIVAFADGLAASAAYWVASAVGPGRFFASASAEVGSIGVIAVHQDWSGAFEQAGIAATVLANRQSPFKGEASIFEPLSKGATEYIRGQLDMIGAKFIQSVARGRGVTAGDVIANYGRGRTLLAGPAKAAGMIDRISNNFMAALVHSPARPTGSAVKVTQPPSRSFMHLSPEQRRRRLQLEAKR